jgi:uncharacterized membrane protein
MPIVSIVFGLALIGLGVWGYATSELEGNLKYTALIPAAVGVILAVCGAVALVERFLKHAMHLAAVIGLIGLVVAAGRFISKAAKDGVDFHKTSTQAVLGMIGLCLVFLALCINSFIQARRRRMNRPPT